MINRIKQLQAFLKNDINNSSMKYPMKLAYVEVKEANIARDCFLKLIKEDKNYGASHYQFQKLYESLNKLEEAKGIYKNGIETAQQIEKKTLLELQEPYNILIEIEEYGY